MWFSSMHSAGIYSGGLQGGPLPNTQHDNSIAPLVTCGLAVLCWLHPSICDDKSGGAHHLVFYLASSFAYSKTTPGPEATTGIFLYGSGGWEVKIKVRCWFADGFSYCCVLHVVRKRKKKKETRGGEKRRGEGKGREGREGKEKKCKYTSIYCIH